MIKCKICEREFKNKHGLMTHVSISHKNIITPKKYYDKYFKKDGEGICKECNEQTKYKSGKYKIFCSPTCAQLNKETRRKAEQTCLKKYGVTNAFQIKEVKENKERNDLKNYGIKHFTNHEKCKKTNLKKYGVEYYSQTKKFKNQQKQKSLVHFRKVKKEMENDGYIVKNTEDEFIKNDNYIIYFTCNKGHNHQIIIHNWDKGVRCGKCDISKPEIELKKILKCESQIQLGKYRFDLGFIKYKSLIEFNGDYWHMNPEIYKANYFHKKMGIIAKEKWNKDKKRVEYAESLGYKVLTIWEKDYNKNRQKIINECRIFLKE